MKRPFVLGLTGSIGMGKSTVASMFRHLGVPVFDADAAVHQLQGPAGALVPAVEMMFPGTTGLEGVDRTLLGGRVLGNPTALARLEALVHPAVWRLRKEFRRRHRARRLIVLDVPLLFETGTWRLVDAIAVVSAPASVQRRRVLARPRMSPERLREVLARQLPDSAKRRRANFLIPTGGSIATTGAVVRRLVACLEAHGSRYCERCARSSSTPKPPA